MNKEDYKLIEMPGYWFKFSEYYLLEKECNIHTKKYFITPKPDSEISWYKPFEEYPQILEDFINLLIEVDKIFKSQPPKHSSNSYNEMERKIGQTVLRFTNKYGLLGFFWAQVHNINPIPEVDNQLRVFKKKINTISSDPFFTFVDEQWHTMNGNPPEKYDNFAEVFFPQLERPFPAPVLDRSYSKFYPNYSETIGYYYGSLVRPILNHFKHWKKAEQQDNDTSKLFTEEEIKKLNLRSPYNSFCPELKYKDGNWQINWTFDSLLEALSLMYFLNFTEDLGEQSIKICHNKTCGKLFPVGGANGKKKGSIYCSKSCGNAARVARHRRKNK